MSNGQMKERIRQALDAETSGLRTSQAQRERLYENAVGGRKVKRKLTAGLVFAMILVLLAAAAVAAVLLTHREIVEQVAVPLAQEAETKEGMSIIYSTEELAELVRTLSENGFPLEENNRIVQAMKNGSGYSVDETIMEICRKAFGGLIGTWTLEEQDWFERMMYECGASESYTPNLPGEGNMTYETAEAFAFSALKKAYGEDLAPEDRTAYRLERFFNRDSEEGEANWYFCLVPRDLDHAQYQVTFTDRDPWGTAETGTEKHDWTKPYTADELVSAFYPVYGWHEQEWPQEAWQKLHEMMAGAVLEENDGNLRKHRGYLATAYPDPAEGEVTREDAVRAAAEALANGQAAFDSAVFTEYGGKRAWLVGLSTGQVLNEWEDGVPGLYVVTVNGTDGSVESIRQGTEDDDGSMAFVPEAAYEKAGEGLLKKSDYIRIAAEAIRKQYPEPDPLDRNEFIPVFQPAVHYVEIEFRTRNVRHGNASATMLRDGTVREATADVSAPDEENLYSRYRSAYGDISEWDQETWVKLGKDFEDIDPQTVAGKLLKAGRFPEQSTVRVSRGQAEEAALNACGARVAEVYSCVLVDAKPHPVWKACVLTTNQDMVIGVDAETGETVSREPWKTDLTPGYVRWSAEQERRRTELESLGAVYIAAQEVTYAFGNMTQDEPGPDVEDETLYETVQDGLTVRFLSYTAGEKSYEVELDGNGYVIRCAETDAVSAAERPDPPAEETEEEEEPAPDSTGEYTPDATPAPQAGGKPWFWGKLGDGGFWDRLEAAMERYGVTGENVYAKIDEWFAQYGSRETWPDECFVIWYWFDLSRDNPDTFLDRTSYPILPAEGKPAKEELAEKVRAAFHRAADRKQGAAWVDSLRISGRLWWDGNYGKPVWHFALQAFEDASGSWEDRGYVYTDEDGNVLMTDSDVNGFG